MIDTKNGVAESFAQLSYRVTELVDDLRKVNARATQMLAKGDLESFVASMNEASGKCGHVTVLYAALADIARQNSGRKR